VTKTFLINTRDKPGLLIAVIRELAGIAEISFEGWLGKSGLSEIPGVSFWETMTLGRTCQHPRFDFLILPLTDETVPAIQRVITKKNALTDSSGIIHVQIAVGDRMVFGAYDNFHRDCVVAYEGLPTALLDHLLENGVIRSCEASG